MGADTTRENQLTQVLAAIAEKVRQGDAVSLRTLAREIGISVSTAQRILRAGHLNFRNVVSSMRLLNAEQVVRTDPALKIEAVSLLAGWRSRRGLYVAVQRIRRCTVSNWREQIRDGSIVDSASFDSSTNNTEH
jgi:AraC-like DNA-binding protein